MPNYEIKISAVGNSQERTPKPSNYCTWKCPFCQGKGINPNGKTAFEKCPACHGHINWEADTVSATLSTCGRCIGNGRVNYMGNWAPCPTCKGSGKV
jgi:DnaJ-class molecular chaperone